MSKITYFSCDRCGKMEKLNPLRIIPYVRFYKSQKLKLIFSRHPDERSFGFEPDEEFDLCEECLTSCYKWLKAGKQENGGIEND